MRKITENEIQDILNKEKSNIVLVNVLSKMSFEEEHIPYSVNVPADSPDFIQQVKQHVVDSNTPVIVYCSGPQCPASKNAATRLEKAGFTNVMHFFGGMEEWKNAGKEVQTGIL